MGKGNRTEFVITYKGDIDYEKDADIRKAIGAYITGSGFAFGSLERDHTASVPNRYVDRVVRDLKKIKGISIQKLMKKWVNC